MIPRLVLGLILALSSGVPGSPWKELAPGMDLGRFQAQRPSSHGDAGITILRIDPRSWDLDIVGITATGEPSGHTAREWGTRQGLAAVINAGMYATDFRTHVGYMRSGDHVNSPLIHRKYHSVAAFDPHLEDLPPFRIFDLDAPGNTLEAIRKDYASVVQNLRLVKRPGENRWPQQEKRWSEAALGEDREGRVLFILCRSPFSMHDLNEELLGLGIGLVAAQHLEGGAEAQLYVSVNGFELEVLGSYESFISEHDDGVRAHRIPNVIGVRQRKPAATETSR